MLYTKEGKQIHLHPGQKLPAHVLSSLMEKLEPRSIHDKECRPMFRIEERAKIKE